MMLFRSTLQLVLAVFVCTDMVCWRCLMGRLASRARMEDVFGEKAGSIGDESERRPHLLTLRYCKEPCEPQLMKLDLDQR